MTKWTIVDGAWTKVPAPPQDLPYFTRIATLSASQNKEASNAGR